MNKRIFFLSFVAVLLSAAAKAASADTIHAEQFGILPYTYENQTVKMQEALRACKDQGAKVLAFRPGRYDFWSEGAVRKEFFVSNTSSEEECPSKVKTIGIYLEDLADLTIEGNGATLMFHGKMTMIALHHCSHITLRNFHTDFDRTVPQDLEINHDCVENMTCTPEVEIRGNYFTRTSTRGTLMTTPRKVVIADNTYYKTGMSAILIEGDAEGWYESGPVNDVLIENNSFIECAFNGGPAGAVIALNPSNRIVDANRPVHRNVRIIGNRFRTFGNPLLFAKSTQGLTFRDNTVTYSPEVKNQPKLFLLNGCKDVSIEKNQFPTPLDKEQTQTSNMP